MDPTCGARQGADVPSFLNEAIFMRTKFPGGRFADDGQETIQTRRGLTNRIDG